MVYHLTQYGHTCCCCCCCCSQQCIQYRLLLLLFAAVHTVQTAVVLFLYACGGPVLCASPSGLPLTRNSAVCLTRTVCPHTDLPVPSWMCALRTGHDCSVRDASGTKNSETAWERDVTACTLLSRIYIAPYDVIKIKCRARNVKHDDCVCLPSSARIHMATCCVYIVNGTYLGKGDILSVSRKRRDIVSVSEKARYCQICRRFFVQLQPA
jgi:hypothetical protein